MCGEKHQELGRSEGFLPWMGALVLCPPPPYEQVSGHEARSCRDADDPSGVGSAYSTLRR
jgi:hypothetical protein